MAPLSLSLSATESVDISQIMSLLKGELYKNICNEKYSCIFQFPVECIV